MNAGLGDVAFSCWSSIHRLEFAANALMRPPELLNVVVGGVSEQARIYLRLWYAKFSKQQLR